MSFSKSKKKNCSTSPFLGYQLDIDQRTCLDIDECREKNGGCGQHCTNLDGGYEVGWANRLFSNQNHFVSALVNAAINFMPIGAVV